MMFQYLPPIGTGSVDAFKAKGWNIDDATEYLQAYYQVMSAPVTQQYLRIPGTAEYWHALDVNIAAVLGGHMQPKAALDATAAAWEKITERYGRDRQKTLYKASFA
jgi:multiple sugar transport system substrate-binding protein